MTFYKKYLQRKPLEIILILGILLRIAVFFFQSPFNNDPHFYVIEYILEHRAIPMSSDSHQAFQPPLYYVIASLFLYLGNEKTVQIFSLLLSIGTLFTIYWLINKLTFIHLDTKKCCLLLASLLPQFILFGNYISNDTLSYLIGSIIFVQIFNYIHRPNLRNQNILAICLGIGLLTKGTLLAFAPSLILLIIIVNLRSGVSKKKILSALFIFVLISSSTGSYKFVENTFYYGQPFIHNLDFAPPWAEKQKPTYIGLKSIYDINLLKLIKHPTGSKHTSHSYPLMMYGTFWYKYIPTPNFVGNLTNLKYLGSVIYILALLPTFLFFAGFFRILSSVPGLLQYRKLDKPNFDKTTYEVISLFVLITNLLVVIAMGIKYDVWSCFQSRLLFPSFVAIIILFNSGIVYINGLLKGVQKYIYYVLICLFLSFILYFCSEICGQILDKLPALTPFHPLRDLYPKTGPFSG